MKGNYITFYNFGVLREVVHQILAGEGLIFRGLAWRILRAQIQSEIRGPQIITIYFEVKRFTRMKLFDNWGTAPMFIDVQTNILHYYFGVPPAPWTNSLCEIFWKRSRTKVPNNTTPHTTQNKKHKTSNNSSATRLWELPCQNWQKSGLKQIILGWV